MASIRNLLMGAGLVGLVASASTAFADPPCLADIQKLCSTASGAQGALQACLKSHESQLSADCKSHVDGLRKTGQQLATVCVWDMERFCPDTAPGGGRILTCLQQHEDDLSPECKAQFKR